MSIGLEGITPEMVNKMRSMGEDNGESSPIIQNITDAPKSSADGFELPTGYLDGDGVLHNDVMIGEITGEEEDLLTARKMPVHQRMQKILENCVVSIGTHKRGDRDWSDVIKGLVVADRLYCMLKIRIVSLGPLFTFKVKCVEDGCEKFSNQTVSLNDFKFEGMNNPSERVWGGKLPKTGFEYVAKVQIGADEDKIAKAGDGKDTMSLAMLTRLLELNKQKPVTLDMVKRLGAIDRQHLREDFKSHEGTIDNEVDVTCSYCGVEFKTDIQIGSPSFFFPSAMLKS